jgi:hypothetical protein
MQYCNEDRYDEEEDDEAGENCLGHADQLADVSDDTVHFTIKDIVKKVRNTVDFIRPKKANREA